MMISKSLKTKSKSNENPVYYIQYAHARVCSVLRQLSEKGIAWTVGEGIEKLSQLTDEIERGLFKKLLRYPEIIENAAIKLEKYYIE